MRPAGDTSPQCQETTVEEFMAILRLFIFLGLRCDVKNPTAELWGDTDAQRPLYRAVVDRNQFLFLLQCLTFHDPNLLIMNYVNDMFAKMRDFLDMFEQNIHTKYNHTELVCLDESLRNHFSQTNCDFLVFMPDKPGQMGLFFYTLADSKDRYMSRIIPKVKSAVSEEESKVDTHELVMKISSDILGSGRNLCADRGFTAINTVEELYKNDVTFVGTVRSDRKGLPTAAKKIKEWAINSTEFCWKENSPVMCLSYVPKRNKNVLVVTTAHNEPITDGGFMKKPEAVLFYSEQRCGVDIMNKMIRELSTQPKTGDWRMAVFTFVIDIACINTQIILRYKLKKSDQRRVYLKNLVHQLVTP